VGVGLPAAELLAGAVTEAGIPDGEAPVGAEGDVSKDDGSKDDGSEDDGSEDDGSEDEEGGPEKRALGTMTGADTGAGAVGPTGDGASPKAAATSADEISRGAVMPGTLPPRHE
jgi:hypothetical protein